MKFSEYVFCFLFMLALSSCSEDYAPKPRGYFRIDFPEKKYTQYSGDCPYTFEMPFYAKIEKDVMTNSEPCWINIVFPNFNAKIHISYKKVNKNLEPLIEDAHTLAYKHTIKADAIFEKLYSDNQKKVYGLLYEIKGDAASSVQFYVTDSVNHYLRGALYFNVRPNKDSLLPVIQFLKPDIEHLMETFEWK